jgi:serine/threonine protein kinase
MSEARKTVLDDRYDVVRPLGSGGMGEVYLARDRVLGRDVALKVLRKQYAGDDEFAERFKREAMSAASLSHPNIIQVYDRGETEEGASYIAMEYVPGGTLKERIFRDGPLEAADAAGIGAQVAEALGAAHDRGMVHRDIKPQNVLLTARGGAKVADFGIARAGSSATISRTGSVMGTAGYMSPEQALGKPATPKSDLYSLGVVLYEALTGELPYTADNPIAVSMKHVNEPLRPPRTKSSGTQRHERSRDEAPGKRPGRPLLRRRRACGRPLEGEPRTRAGLGWCRKEAGTGPATYYPSVDEHHERDAETQARPNAASTQATPALVADRAGRDPVYPRRARQRPGCSGT